MDIKRINELAKKAKTVGLTDSEKLEQSALRREYIDSVVGNLRAQLENTYIRSENGEILSLKARESEKPETSTPPEG